jgi:hypothetical protein
VDLNETQLVFRQHAIRRMLERRISVDDVRHVVDSGEQIEDYPDDYPLPRCLLLGWRGGRPLHVVAAHSDVGNEIIIITVYVPDQKLWSADFRERREQ